MSLFLGPIHQWLYDKIIFQEDLTDALIDAGKAEGWSELTEELANECHSYDRRPLEEAVTLTTFTAAFRQELQMQRADMRS